MKSVKIIIRRGDNTIVKEFDFPTDDIKFFEEYCKGTTIPVIGDGFMMIDIRPVFGKEE